ncbi:unnamed protein product (macronuclear) [Paramecium tetraurelia]|uniref:CDT1 Geminin-binding domain-containing protein n=1 Tax=Paramecium tetraurelia TaxID=5888 RepID=A0EIT0_PARTE|nr:uncharacterized protein GSPATT00027550001 [Paramecium tetraurelia]CAK95221.1 unnamed protein product [Paramecium tetraurelia]|eukprot:XP_001462594.1 hypothetical protein (macronuclear) [Paramecium tetraurelia strain d4-2]
MNSYKLIKTQQDNNTNGEDESTRHLSELADTKISSIKVAPATPINFLSLRDRFGQISDQYPLPIKFQQLLQTMRNIEQTYWKKRKPLTYDIKTNAIKILQIGQLLKLDKDLYEVKIVNKSIELIFNHIPTENLPQFQPFQSQLPAIFEKRITSIRNSMDKLVQETHENYLKSIGQESFLEYSKEFKIYYPTFDMNFVQDISPIQLPFQIYSDEQRDQIKQIVEITIKYFNQRSVSFVFYNNLIQHLLNKIPLSKEIMEKSLMFLIKIQPDFLQITNAKKEQQKNKWIVQINKLSTEQKQIESLKTYFY